jgi:hypothetical protein
MMKIILRIILINLSLLVFCNGCSSFNENKTNSDVEKILILTKSNISLLQGAWGIDPNLNANFGIYTDSIYYPDPDLWYKYSINADTLIIYSEINIEDKILVTKISKDSLVLKYLQVNEVVRYSRRK